MFARFSQSQDRPGWPGRTIQLEADGFSVVEAGEPEAVRCRWADVREVFAYKLDLFSYDEICLGFRLDAAGRHAWVGESYTGYRELLAELPRRFPGIRTDWFSDVVHPAFAENRMTLWSEPPPRADLTADSAQPRKKSRWVPWR